MNAYFPRKTKFQFAYYIDKRQQLYPLCVRITHVIKETRTFKSQVRMNYHTHTHFYIYNYNLTVKLVK